MWLSVYLDGDYICGCLCVCMVIMGVGVCVWMVITYVDVCVFGWLLRV